MPHRGCIPGTAIAVDYWAKSSDHTTGLSAKWDLGPIYCSEITKRLALAKFGLRADLVRALPLQQRVVLDDGKSGRVAVTFVDAHHCPGSIMAILEGPFGCILHTGDFRCDTLKMIQNSALNAQKFDHVYLDASFCSPEYAFPPRSEVTRTICHAVSGMDEITILVAIDTLGKEELLLAIGIAANSLVVVDEARFSRMQLYMEENIMKQHFTVDPSKGRVLVVPRRNVSERLDALHGLGVAAVGILPTGWTMAASATPASPTLLTFPYSLHCSYAELVAFVSYLNPVSVSTTVPRTQENVVRAFGEVWDMGSSLQYRNFLRTAAAARAE